MARSGEGQRDGNSDTGAQARLYTTKDVHKRRAGEHADRPRPALSASDLPKTASTRASGAAAPAPEARANEPDGNRAKDEPAREDAANLPGEGDLPGEASLPSEGDLPRTPEGEDGPDEPGESETAEASETATRRRMPHVKPRHVLYALVGIALVVAVAACSLFAWNRWGRFDDHVEMQGEWYVAGTTVPVAIDDSTIHLTDDVVYEYEIDDHVKTIRYTFGPMEGQGRYWFSDDRSYFAIVDGEGFNGVQTTLDDLVHSLTGFRSADGRSTRPFPEGEGVIAFCREPGTFATMIRDATERAKARAAKQKAAEERKAAEKEAAEAAKAEAEAVAAAAAEAAAAEAAYEPAYGGAPAEESAYDPPLDEAYIEEHSEDEGEAYAPDADGTPYDEEAYEQDAYE